MLVIDDSLLFAVLAGTAAEDLQAAGDQGAIFTTGSWYWRLSRALHGRTSTGSLSRAMADLTAAQRARVIVSVERLPDNVGLLSLRELVPVMTALDTGRPLNLLTAEAIAVAVRPRRHHRGHHGLGAPHRNLYDAGRRGAPSRQVALQTTI